MVKSEEQYTPIFYNKGEMDKPASELIAELRSQLAKIRGKFHDVKEKYGYKDYIDFMQGCLTSAIISAGYSEDNFRSFEDKQNSQSPEPTCKESLQVHDTLVDGDWFQGTEEEYRKVLELCIDPSAMVSTYPKTCEVVGFLAYNGITCFCLEPRITQLTPSEFLRRAENTFKK